MLFATIHVLDWIVCNLYQEELLGHPSVRSHLFDVLLLLLFNLIPPETVLVERSKAVDDDGNGQGEDENAGKSTEATNDFSWQIRSKSLLIF